MYIKDTSISFSPVSSLSLSLSLSLYIYIYIYRERERERESLYGYLFRLSSLLSHYLSPHCAPLYISLSPIFSLPPSIWSLFSSLFLCTGILYMRLSLLSLSIWFVSLYTQVYHRTVYLFLLYLYISLSPLSSLLSLRLYISISSLSLCHPSSLSLFAIPSLSSHLFSLTPTLSLYSQVSGDPFSDQFHLSSTRSLSRKR